MTPLAVIFSQTNLAVFLCFSSVNFDYFCYFFGNIRQLFNRDIPKVRKKDRVSTPSLVIHRVRFFKNLQKSTLAFKVG